MYAAPFSFPLKSIENRQLKPYAYPGGIIIIANIEGLLSDRWMVI